MNILLLIMSAMLILSHAAFSAQTPLNDILRGSYTTNDDGDTVQRVLLDGEQVVSGTLTIGEDLTVARDLTVNRDVYIDGTLIGGSPLKVMDSIDFVDVDENYLFHLGVAQYDAHIDDELSDDLSNALVFMTETVRNANNIEYIFWDKDDSRPVMMMNEGADTRATTYNRSLQVGKALGFGPYDGDFTKAEGYNYADFNTPVTGADIGVEDDIEAKGSIYAQGDMLAEGDLTVSGRAFLGQWQTYVPVVTLVGGSGNTVPTYATTNGRYKQIDNIVYVDILFGGDGGVDGAGTGQINVSLPIESSATIVNGSMGLIVGQLVSTGSDWICSGTIPVSATTIRLYKFDNISAVSTFVGNDQPNGSRAIRLHFWYEVE